MKSFNPILSEYGTTIFTVMSALANEHGAINLGQGFPDQDGPEDIRAVAADNCLGGPNQYPPMMGIPDLRQGVAAHNKRFYDLDVDWQAQVMVTSGATEAIAACLFGLIEPGDEVVAIEPTYDCYLPILRRAGATPRLVRVEPPDWALPLAALESVFSEKTKLIMINSPMNPASKVFRKAELTAIAGLMEKYDAYAICDEVYEHMVYDGHRHIPLMTLPGMAERTLRIGSAGKTFSMTGWKVGYTTGPANLIQAAAKAHQFLTFTTPPNLQAAVAYGLGKDNKYFENLSKEMENKRNRLANGLAAIGFEIMPSEGTYFLTADFRAIAKRTGFNGDDTEFCKHITTEAGVTAVPFSAFYQGGAETSINHFIRFCYCKQDSLLDAAVEKLGVFFGTK
ncbi:MAG: aminotransferase [Pseudomonadota bacterium]|nr:aminotransferase [Pseudomonadota bacterium]